jgi:hypothetical protein
LWWSFFEFLSVSRSVCLFGCCKVSVSIFWCAMLLFVCLSVCLSTRLSFYICLYVHVFLLAALSSVENVARHNFLMDTLFFLLDIPDL